MWRYVLFYTVKSLAHYICIFNNSFVLRMMVTSVSELQYRLNFGIPYYYTDFDILIYFTL